MRACVYTGSFDPLTMGHLDIIKRAAALFDTVYVAVLQNSKKQYMFDVADRVGMAETAVRGIGNVRVVYSDGLLANLMRELDVGTIVRGIRTGADLEVEQRMAAANARLLPGAETVFLSASPEYVFLSSSLIKELLMFGADIAGYVPDEILDTIRRGEIG